MTWTKAFNVQGPAGAQLRTGSGAPSSSLGTTGDTYVDTTSTGAPIFYAAKTSSGWPSSGQSLVGATGAAGPAITSGVGTPGPPYTGHNNNDYFLDTSTGNFFQLQAGKGWVQVANLAGPQGNVGNTGPSAPGLRSGSGAPSSSNPSYQVDGDFFIQTDVTPNLLWGPRASGSWPSSGLSTQGSQGIQGVQGISGSNGAAGTQITVQVGTPGPPYTGHTNGDFILDSATGNFFQLQAGKGWVQVANLAGPKGNAGLNILSGSGAPTSSTTGQTGQVYVDTLNAVLYVYGSSSWPSTGTSIMGAQGNFLRTGSGAPASSLGNPGDTYVDTAASQFYPAKTSNGWTASPINLVGSTGAAGLSVLTGSGAPASSIGVSGQSYVDTTNGALYVKSSTGWGTALSLIGQQGAAGLAVLSGSGAPGSSLGVVGQPGYIDTAAGALYAAKTSSGWPSTPLSLIGATGPASPSITSGTGAPSSTNPGGTIAAGSFYIRTDTLPNQLFGPYTSANGWPSTYTAMGGGTFQTTSGPPASSLGSIGDCAFDLTNALFYPPKTSSGWTATPINMVGPTGPSGQVQPTFGSYGNANGPYCTLSNITTSSTAIPAQVPGTSQTCYFVPQTASAFTGGTIINYTATGANLTFTLYDLTASVSIYSVTLAKATVSTVGPFASTAYPLTAGHQYVWNITGSSSSYCSVQPNYLFPSTWSGSIGNAPCQIWTSAAISGTAANLQPPGLSGQTCYYANPNPAFLYGYNIVVTGSSSATCQLQLYNLTSSTVLYTTPTITASTAGTLLNGGPFGISAAYVPANAQLTWRILGSGTVAASVNFSVCQ